VLALQLHALDMGVTIVVINHITKAGYTVLFDHECCKIRDKNNKHIRNIIRKNQLFLLHLITSYSSYFGGKKGISENKTSFFLLMIPVSITRLYKVKHVYMAALKPEHIDLAMLHRQLMHIALDMICKMISSGALEGMELTDDQLMAMCKTCKQAKATCKQI